MGPPGDGPAQAGLGEAVVAGMVVAAVVMALIGFPTECDTSARDPLFLLANVCTVVALVVGAVTFEHKGPAQVLLWVATGISTVLVSFGWMSFLRACTTSNSN